ncbi:MAG: hypothetical protein ICV79_27400, partial [Flavisolibacter sp.]|nr:hypothetical protein [Flavisolibacter sp.]
MPRWTRWWKKQVIEDGEHYLCELQHDEYGGEIQQHENVMKDDRDQTTTTRSPKKSTD